VCSQTDPGLFFSDSTEDTAAAKRVCAGCPVRVRCLERAMEADERWGVWGGTSEDERQRLRAARDRSRNRLAA
jgi:WhiB family redox-sensing transcriptional regulator